jgi:serine/threonine protein kinase
LKAADPFIVMEWMAGGSWFDALGEDPPPPAYQRIRAARETASALAYLHHLLIGIIHGDIKGLNVLRARDGSSKVPRPAHTVLPPPCIHAAAAAGVRLWWRRAHDGHIIHDGIRRRQDGDDASVVCARAVHWRL